MHKEVEMYLKGRVNRIGKKPEWTVKKLAPVLSVGAKEVLGSTFVLAFGFIVAVAFICIF